MCQRGCRSPPTYRNLAPPGISPLWDANYAIHFRERRSEIAKLSLARAEGRPRHAPSRPRPKPHRA